jgi:hypothetical protein
LTRTLGSSRIASPTLVAGRYHRYAPGTGQSIATTRLPSANVLGAVVKVVARRGTGQQRHARIQHCHRFLPAPVVAYQPAAGSALNQAAALAAADRLARRSALCRTDPGRLRRVLGNLHVTDGWPVIADRAVATAYRSASM